MRSRYWQFPSRSVSPVACTDPGGAGQVLRVGQKRETTPHAALPDLVRQRQLCKDRSSSSSSSCLLFLHTEWNIKDTLTTFLRWFLFFYFFLKKLICAEHNQGNVKDLSRGGTLTLLVEDCDFYNLGTISRVKKSCGCLTLRKWCDENIIMQYIFIVYSFHWDIMLLHNLEVITY